MHNVETGLNRSRTALNLVGGLMLVGFLTGCWEVNTYVKVDTSCPSPSGTRIPIKDEEAGLCYARAPLTAPLDAYGALNTANNNQPITDHSHFCNVGTQPCKSTPGTCLQGGMYKPCKTYFTPDSGNPNNGSCSCGCPPAQ